MAVILLSGATGLVGSAMLPMFDEADEVHVLARDPSSITSRPNLHVHPFDLAAPLGSLDLPDKIDTVMHLAQSEHFRDFPARAREIFDVNVTSLLTLLGYARMAGARSFVFTSSGAVYGSGELPMTEGTAPARPDALGFYGSTKLCGEILAENYAPFFSVAILRLFFAYGRGQRQTMLIPRLVDSVREGHAIILQGDDGIRINPIHALDASAACLAAANLDGFNLVNVAGPETLSLRQLAEMIGRKLGRAPSFEIRGNKAGDFVADTTQMTRLLQAPSRRFEEHVDELL